MIRPTASSSGFPATDRTFTGLKNVTVRGIARYVKTQPLSFWLICGYLFFEYVRPQSLYPAIDVLPWVQIVVILAVIALVFEGGLKRLNVPGTGALIFFTSVVILSSYLAFRPELAFTELSLYLSWVLIFFLITTSITTQERFFVFMLLFLLASFKMSQFGARSWASIGFGFRNWGVSGAPGWFSNSGELGIQMCIFIPLATAFIWGLRDHWKEWGRWKLGFFLLFPVTGLMTIIASSSRGAIVGIAVVLLWWLAFVSRRFKTFVIVALVAVTTYVVLPEEQLQRFETAGDDRTSTERTNRWNDGLEIISDNPVLGVGYRNWRPYYAAHYPHRSAHGYSHNIFVDAGAELGLMGLLGFLALIAATFRLNWRSRRLLRGPPGQDRFLYMMAYGLDGALVGYLASGFFVSVLFYPYFWINFAMTAALHLAARNRVRVAHRLSAAAMSGEQSSVRLSDSAVPAGLTSLRPRYEGR